MAQSRTSYLPKEILWGHRFVNMCYYVKAQDFYMADYAKFNETEQVFYYFYDLIPIFILFNL